MDEEIYDSLPDDLELAFAHLEGHFRSQMETNIADSDEGNVIAHFRAHYINQVIAAAKALDIAGIKEYEPPDTQRNVWEYYESFSNDVMSLIIQIKINHAQRRRKYSVSLTGPEKLTIRHYIEQIRQLVEESNIAPNKKEAIFKKLADLTLEIDRGRTRFEVIADGIRAIARLSGDIEREGAEPWWKWVKLLFGVIDDAKEKESSSSLPGPEDRKKLEPPRKQLPKPRDIDEEVPF